MPKMWFQPAGLRRLPMKSEPSATGSSRWASATAAPPLDPPALTAVSQALGVVPNRVLKVWEPRPSSGMLDLPITMQPAAFMRSVMMLSLRGMCWANNVLPRVLGNPKAWAVSLIAWGMPCSQPRD
jgi:hypothetical protein